MSGRRDGGEMPSSSSPAFIQDKLNPNWQRFNQVFLQHVVPVCVCIWSVSSWQQMGTQMAHSGAWHRAKSGVIKQTGAILDVGYKDYRIYMNTFLQQLIFVRQENNSAQSHNIFHLSLHLSVTYGKDGPEPQCSLTKSDRAGCSLRLDWFGGCVTGT